MTAFEIVKDSVDIVDAAGRYGIEVNRHNKALCPFHGDRHPSLSFKGQRFKCFACGAGGDVVDLVGRLASLTPLDAVRELNQTYHLRIDLDKPVPSDEVKRRKRLAESKKAFAEWEIWAANTLTKYYRTLSDWREAYAPKHPNDTPDPRYLEAIHRQGYIEYVLDAVFIGGDLSEKAAFYRENCGMVERIEWRLKQERDRDAGGTWRGDNPSGIVFPFELAAASHTERAA